MELDRESESRLLLLRNHRFCVLNCWISVGYVFTTLEDRMATTSSVVSNFVLSFVRSSNLDI